jgi:hypothetical protein
MRRPILVVLFASALAAAGCGDDRAKTAGSGTTTSVGLSDGDVDSTPQLATPPKDTSAGYPVVKALYLNRFAAQSARKVRYLLSIADSTEINGFVIDMKDEFGLNYKSANPAYRKNEGGTHGFIANPKALVDSLKAHARVDDPPRGRIHLAGQGRSRVGQRPQQ